MVILLKTGTFLYFYILLVLYSHNIAPQNIRCTSHHIDPIVYAILFPHGELGWPPGKIHQEAHRTRQRNTVSPLQFYAYRMAVRNTFSPISQCGKLFQRYIVDSYVRTETARLHFIRHNQAQLRVELYQGLLEHLHSQAEQQNLEPGKVVILPSSFQGSPRAMQQNYQDAMAIVSKYGKPDIFLTFTCNPKSKDILDNLLDGQEPADRPDIISRVFKLELRELLTDLLKRHVLEVPVAYVYVIEFQKRGLPHVHLLLILNNETKLRHPMVLIGLSVQKFLIGVRNLDCTQLSNL